MLIEVLRLPCQVPDLVNVLVADLLEWKVVEEFCQDEGFGEELRGYKKTLERSCLSWYFSKISNLKLEVGNFEPKPLLALAH